MIYLGNSAIATAAFISNMLFYFESGYFDIAAKLNPLLHTWSLAVEVQYYVFFPLLNYTKEATRGKVSLIDKNIVVAHIRQTLLNTTT